MMGGHDRRIASVSLNTPEKYIPALTSRHQVYEHIEHMGEVVCPIRVETQEDGIQQTWEKTIKELALLSFRVV